MMKKTKSFSVLIVDDNREWCLALRKEIKQYPFFDVAAPLHSGNDAIEYIEQHKPDVILLDLIMPVCDGLYVIGHIRKKMPNYRPYIYVLSAIGTEKTNRVLRNLDVEYYSIKPINTSVVAYNLHQLLVEDGHDGYTFSKQTPVLGIDAQIEGFMYELGAPLYLTSTKCTIVALQTCLSDESSLASITSLYKLVANSWRSQATPESVERNIRSTIKNMQKNTLPYFNECFPYGHKKLTNADFLNRAVYLLKRRIEEYFGDQVFVKQSSDLYRTK